MTPELDILVKGGQVVAQRGTIRADVGIATGKIVWIGLDGWSPRAHRVIDAAGLHVLPGVVDPHVHMTSPGSIEEFCAEQMPSMVTGGVTTCMHFAETYGSYIPLLEEHRRDIDTHSLLDVGFHAILMKEIHLRELGRCVEEFGVISFKMYPGAGGAELYPGTLSVDDGFVYRAFRDIARLGPGTIAMVHCENWEIANALTAELRAAGRNDPAVWTDCRPAFCEEDGIRRAIFLAGVTRCPLYIVHSSSGRTPDLVAAARRDGIDVVAETCPHYLTVHRDHPLAMHAKYNPAVKEEKDVEGLWRGLSAGWISTLGSDHIPMKEIGGEDIWATEGGIPGSGTILPILLSEGVNKGRISLERCVELCSTNPARTFGLAPRKGAIAPGADADLVLVDLTKRVTLTPRTLNAEIVLFDGWQLQGWPVLTMGRGEVVMEGGDVIAKPGTGRYVRRLGT